MCPLRAVLVLSLLPLAGGCGTLVSSASERVAASLQAAVLNHNDPETVRDGAPAWLLMVDAMAADAPGNSALQARAAQMYAAYAGGFAADDRPRAARLAERARDYGRAAVCASRAAACDLMTRPFGEFEAALAGFDADDASLLFAAAVGELVFVQTHADDWDAIAGLPRAQALLERVVAVAPAHERGAPHAFLGVLHSLRPPALGGDPAVGRAYFERALALSDGRDLTAKVLFAEHYARLTFDRALHDRLLDEVLAADPADAGYTLANLLAQRRARELQATAGDHFP